MLFFQKILIGAFLLALLASQALMVRWPGVILVPIDYPTIQQAMVSAKPGSRVYVDARRGPYHESILISSENIFVQALYGRAQIVGLSQDEPVVVIVADGVKFSGFEVRGGATGVLIKDVRNASLVDNLVTENLQGISLNQADENLLSSNQVVNNGSIGILIHESSNNSVERNWVAGHSIGGIFLEESSSENLIKKNTFRANQTGVRLLSSPRNQLSENTFLDQSGIGLSSENSERTVLVNNLFEGNQTAIHIANGLHSMIQGNVIRKNDRGLVIEGNVEALTIRGNVLSGNREVALQSIAADQVNATENYWGSRLGPRRSKNEAGLGELVLGNVKFEPWLIVPGR